MNTNSQAIEQTNGNGKVEKAKPAMTLRAFLESASVKSKLAEVASKYLRPEDMIRLALLAATRQPEIAKCTHTSILRALMEAATLGIAPGGTQGRGYLVPRKNKAGELEAIFDPGWRGLIDIARRSGEIKRIEAHVVYAVDMFEVELGLKPTITHHPVLDAEDRGAIVAAYAIAEFQDGTPQFEVMTKSDLDKIRGTSASKGGPWASWPEEMSRKSAVRRLCKYLPYNPILERAIEAATAADETEDRDPVPALQEGDKKPRAKSLAESLRAKAAGQDASDEAASVIAAMETVNEETGEITGGES